MIENDILSGRLAPNTPLKSIRELAKVYNVTRTVISCALDILERKNLITRIPKGLFVKENRREGMTTCCFSQWTVNGEKRLCSADASTDQFPAYAW